MIRITIPGEPAPWGVQAFTVAGHAALRDKPASKSYKARVRLAAQEQYHGPLLDGPLRADIVFYLRRGPSVKRPMPTVKPDLTNLRKAVEDGLTGVVWKDDAQVVMGQTVKVYADRVGSQTVIEITPAGVEEELK